ncbi:unnamed protein product, partial [Sphagnum compactum]
WLCQLTSGVLLYSLLSSFCWMLLEGYQLYKKLVLFFDSEFSKFKIYIIGYGIPIFIIFIAFVCPALIVISINMIIMYISLKNAFSVNSNFKSTANKTKRKFLGLDMRIFSSFLLMILLGITWISFLLYIHRVFSIFSYIFIILNGSQ